MAGNQSQTRLQTSLNCEGRNLLPSLEGARPQLLTALSQERVHSQFRFSSPDPLQQQYPAVPQQQQQQQQQQGYYQPMPYQQIPMAITPPQQQQQQQQHLDMKQQLEQQMQQGMKTLGDFFMQQLQQQQQQQQGLGQLIQNVQQQQQQLKEEVASISMKQTENESKQDETLRLLREMMMDQQKGRQESNALASSSNQQPTNAAANNYSSREAERRSNLMIFNMKEEEEEDSDSSCAAPRDREVWKNVLAVLANITVPREVEYDDLETRAKKMTNVLVDIQRVGPKNPNKPRAIKVCFISADTKMAVLSQAKKLANSDFKHLGFDNDITKEQQDERKKQSASIEIARKNGDKAVWSRFEPTKLMIFKKVGSEAL
jgi:hypothetical protein